MRKVLFTLPLLISVAFFSINNLSFAEPPRQGGGPQGGPAGNPGGGYPQGGPGQGMEHQGMQGQRQGMEGMMNEHRMGGFENHGGMNDMNRGMGQDHQDSRADRNQDGHVGPQEAQLADNIHDTLDKNNDGNIGPRERAWAKEHQGEGSMEGGNESEYQSEEDSSGSSEDASTSFHDMADRNQDGLVDQFEKHQAQKHFSESQGSMDTPPVKPAAYESGLLASAENSNGYFGSQGAHSPENLFDRADKNNDGALGPAERKMAHEHMEQNQFDRKGDQNNGGGFEGQRGPQGGMQGQGFGQQGHNGNQEHQGMQGMHGGPQGQNFQGGQGGPGGMRGGPGGGSGPRR